MIFFFLGELQMELPPPPPRLITLLVYGIVLLYCLGTFQLARVSSKMSHAALDKALGFLLHLTATQTILKQWVKNLLARYNANLQLQQCWKTFKAGTLY